MRENCNCNKARNRLVKGIFNESLEVSQVLFLKNACWSNSHLLVLLRLLHLNIVVCTNGDLASL